MHPATEEILQYFEYDHLPSRLADISAPICRMAHEYAEILDGPELTMGLRKLLEAKDCLVRAALKKPEEEPEEDPNPTLTKPKVYVFTRPECIFAYCPNPELCQGACVHPAVKPAA